MTLSLSRKILLSRWGNTVVPADSPALSCRPIGALPRNRLAASATGGASPISLRQRQKIQELLRQKRLTLSLSRKILLSRRGNTVVPADSPAPSCRPIGALPQNRLASSATGGASPISLRLRQKIQELLRQKCVKNSISPIPRHCEASAHTGCGNPYPHSSFPFKESRHVLSHPSK